MRRHKIQMVYAGNGVYIYITSIKLNDQSSGEIGLIIKPEGILETERFDIKDGMVITKKLQLPLAFLHMFLIGNGALMADGTMIDVI